MLPRRVTDAAVIGFGLTLAVLVAGGIVAVVNVHRLTVNDRLVAHTYNVIGTLDALLSTLKDAETGQRGYLLTEDPKYLQPYAEGLQRLQAGMTHLKDLLSDHPGQQARFALLEPKIAAWMAELERTVALTKKGDRAAAMKIVRGDSGKAMMDELRQAVAAMRQSEKDLLNIRDAESAASARNAIWSILVPAVLGMVLVCIGYYLSQRNQRLGQRSATAIAEQRERLRVTLASIGDAVITTDASGNVTYLNAVAEHLTGWPLGEAAGKPLVSIFRIINELTRQPVDDPVQMVIARGQVVGLANHTVLLCRTGTELPIEDSAAPILDSTGRITGVVLVFHDVTERRRSEEALRRSESRFRLAADALNGIIYDHDYRTGTVERTRGLYEVVGYHPDEVPAAAGWWEEQIHHADRDLYRQRFEAALAAGGPIVLMYRVRHKDGRWLHIVDRAILIRDKAGQPARLVGCRLDVTERMQAEEAAAKAQEIFKLVHSIGRIGHWEWNLLSDENRWSPEIEALYGLPPGGFEGGYQGWLKLVHPDDRPRAEADVQHSMQTGKYFTEFRVIWPDGSVHWLEARAYVFKDDQDRPVRIMGVNMDVTERKRIEETLTEADRRKDEFLATLAHELRNPLAPLRNGLHLMRMANADPQAIESARAMMDRQLTQLIRLVDDLMDVSRISRGKIELRKQRVELAAVVHSAIETSRPLLDQMHHQLTVTLPDQPVIVDADLTRLAQVFANLLNNAAKYSDRDGDIRLSCQRQADEVQVSVKDTGIGIPADQVTKIFEMFSQVGGSRAKSQGGLGIGLTLVRQLVELHGGHIEARSEGPGKGSEFIVRLPIVEVGDGLPAGEPETPELPITALRVLIVDDNRDAADTLAMLLKGTGNDTCTAYDGQQGVDAAAEFRPDVVLLDIGLPKVDGYEVCRRIRRQTWGADVVMVALTGWGQDGDFCRSQDAGFDRHLVKPVDPGSLLTMLAGLPAAAKK
jgi:PAS domain S-box-containing protein